MSFNKYIAVLSLIVLGMVSLHSTCSRKWDCRETVYSFGIGIKAYPDQDSIHVGDTLWLEVNAPTKLTDANTGRLIDYSGAANLGTTIAIAELISVNTINTEANSFFKFFLSMGKEIFRLDTTKFREYIFPETNNGYTFRLAIIPQRKGVYKIFISNAIAVRRNDNCTKASFEINFKETNQHVYLNQIVLPGVTLPPGGGVCLFKVK